MTELINRLKAYFVKYMLTCQRVPGLYLITLIQIMINTYNDLSHRPTNPNQLPPHFTVKFILHLYAELLKYYQLIVPQNVG